MKECFWSWLKMEKNKFLILTKYLLLGGSYGSGRKKKGIFSKSTVANLVLKFILILIFGAIAGSIDLAAYMGLKIVHMEYVLLQMNYSAITAIIFFFGIFSTMGVFYFSNDINFLIPMPLKPETIVASKFTVSLIQEYFITVVILLPCTLVYGIASGMGVIFYILSILFMLFEPILPLAAALLISIFIMPLINKSKKKDLFKTLGGILAVGFGLGINILTRMMGGSSSAELVKNVKRVNSTMLNVFPLGSIASKALVNSNLLYTALFILINACSFVAIIYLAKNLYFKGVQGLSESSSKRKKIDSKKMNKETQKKSILFSYTMKELKILFRTPAYFVNCVMSSFIFPVVILIPMLFNTSDKKGLSSALSYINGPQGFRILVTASVVFGLIMGTMNSVTSTSISREGSNFFVMKYIPIKYSKQIAAKIFSGIFVGAISIILIDIAAFFVVKIPVYVFAYMIITGILGIVFTSIIGMYIDLSMPKLEWDTEQKAVKSNINSFINFLVSILPAAIIIVICIFINVNVNIFFGILSLVLLALDYVTYKVVCISGEKKLDRYES
ncbi:hypothetical protein HGI32_19785 [Clostridium acetobutylicum]|uniref:Uncharacterized membrane protein n=2 Tax=Clostridiaceae TaxID=31979 RepID=Q97MC9_CLOAB|nr:Uncharacterized membrane protein [Clostridium acetobutylicum ATCC 824]AEI31139.1 hypothetical protein SMB_G0274 [Clostridium acetobutylicum DSM 1731]AWV82057.1 hypothetical protein DK921_18650 [Clostridium acetobutylicum]PSM04222.1 hypothetical protein C7T89_19550 [Clostridium sp. NJ4]MBC2396147.1 hypothetical protein [Clostridium acetobutylicum]